MRQKPGFFDEVQSSALEDWQVWSNPRHGSAVWQLFKQIQSPRHVLSELLQNADDAGATIAEVDVQDGEFVFQHNGEDFTDRQFASLCRFGLSEKRTLHTIGFRGIGFKSTFSLGEKVKLLTPTLSVAFEKQQFTAPIWLDDEPIDSGTQIRVAMADVHRPRELNKSLDEWLATPVSLLFFKNLRQLRVRETIIAWHEEAPGPVSSSHWMRLNGTEDSRYLIVRSDLQPFPDEAIEEIKAERLLPEGEDPNLPPCQVEIVLGVEGRLFVVLPTGVVTKLPFACNAPFVQDPARVKLKDSETSPTNRWLLGRAGELAAKAMLAWLQNEELSTEERAQSYGLLPDVNRLDNTLEGVCAGHVKTSFEAALGDSQILLSSSGQLRPAKGCMSVPGPILQVWSATTVAEIFDDLKRPPLSSLISNEDRQKLQNWGFIHYLDREAITDRLRKVKPPKPQSWAQLLRLWSYLSSEVTRNPWYRDPKLVYLVPVQASPDLHSAQEVSRIGEKKQLHTDADWEFLAEFLVVLNQNWPRFLAEQKRTAQEHEDSPRLEEVSRAYSLLESLGLADTSNMDALAKQIAERFFARQGLKLQEYVRIAQIFASIGSSIGPEFKFATRDRRHHSTDYGVVFDASGRIENLVSPDWAENHILHPAYLEGFTSCTRDDWDRWIRTGRSGLLSAPSIAPESIQLWDREQLKKRLHKHCFLGELSFPYKTDSFEVQDFDFDRAHWSHWSASEEADIYAQVTSLILSQDRTLWERKLSAKALQIATTGTRKPVTQDPLVASWILKLRELPCLRDTQGNCRRPIELLRRTPETEALIGLEPFIEANVDSEAVRPLLDALGVGTTPTGPERLLQRLQALAETDTPPIEEVEKWYRRLDTLLASASTADVLSVREEFASNALIFSDAHGWLRSGEVFLSTNEEDVPDAPTVRASVRTLTLWRRLEVAERPTLSMVFKWLEELPKSQALPADVLRRVRSILQRHPAVMWEQGRHWPNLQGELVPIEQLRFSFSMRSLCPYTDLFANVKRQTADFQMLSFETLDSVPFREIPTLASNLEERADANTKLRFDSQPKPWLTTLANDLSRVLLKDEATTNRVRRTAERLLKTEWLNGPSVESVPYLDGMPAGPGRRAKAIWTGLSLLVESGPMAKQADPVARELGRAFDFPSVADAIKFCFEREPAIVTDYLALQFELEIEQVTARSQTELAASDSARQAVPVPIAEVHPTSPISDEQETSPDIVTDEETVPCQEPQSDQHSEAHTNTQAERRRGHERSQQPTLMDRFAALKGYRKLDAASYANDQGSRIIRSDGGAFPWEQRDSRGNLLRFLLPIDMCLQTSPVEINVSQWELCRKNPHTYALVLVEPDHRPIAFQGSQLCNLLESQMLTVFPASYRLVLNQSYSP